MAKTKRSAPAPQKSGNGEQSKPTAAPKVKSLAEPSERKVAPASAPTAYMVTLVSGLSYAVAGREFILNRGIVVTDEKVVAAVRSNNRFRCQPVVRKQPARAAEKEQEE